MSDIVRGDKMNKWINYAEYIILENEDVTREGLNTYECPYCNFVLQLMEGTPEENLYNYCPRCGQKLIQQSGEGAVYEQDNL